MTNKLILIPLTEAKKHWIELAKLLKEAKKLKEIIKYSLEI